MSAPRRVAWQLLLVGATLLAGASLPAQDTSRTQRVEFTRGKTSTVIAGTVRDYGMNVYVIAGRAGQTMTATLETNAANQFTVMSPGGSIVLFDGTTRAGSFSGKLPTDGDYRITVFLARDAPRRNETGNYSLTIDMK